MKVSEKYIKKINAVNPLWIALALYFIFVGISMMTYNYRPLACDMAEYLNNPLRILHGDIPYINFWLLFPPGEVYFPALIYKLIGINTDTVRIITILASSLVPFAGFYLGRNLFGENTKSIITASMLYLFSVVTNYEGPDYISLYLLFIVLAVIYLIKFIKEDVKTPEYIFLSGLMMCLAFLFKLYEVGGVFAGFLLFIIWFSLKDGLQKKDILKFIFVFLLPSIVFLITLIIAFGNHAGKMLSELFIESVRNGTSMNLPYFNDLFYVAKSINMDIVAIFSSGQYSMLFNLIFHLMKFAVVLGYYLVPIAGSLIFLGYYFVKPGKERLAIASVIFLWALLSFPKALGRSDLAHLAPSVAPFMIFIYYVVIKSGQGIFRRFSMVLIGVMFLSITFPFFKAFSILTHPLYYVYTENGAVPFKKEKDMLDFKQTFNFIIKNTNKDDYIFVTPWDAPPIYALTGLRNPTYYDSLNDLMIRPSDEKQNLIIKDIIKHKTKYIIHNADWGYDNKPEQQFRRACNLLQKFINESCTPVAQFGFYTIYEINNF